MQANVQTKEVQENGERQPGLAFLTSSARRLGWDPREHASAGAF